MINIMYLVLTALLALNVSVEILNAFHVVNRSIVNSNAAALNKSNQVMNDFTRQLTIQKAKAQPYYEKAAATRLLVDDFVRCLEHYKTQIILQSGGWIDVKHKRHNKAGDPLIGSWTSELGELYNDDNLDASTRMMVENGGGDALRKQLDDTRTKLLALFENDSARKVFEAQLPLRIDKPMINREGIQKDWVHANFEMVPTIAAVTLLNKFQNDARNSETQILDHLYKSINALDIKVDKMQARVIAPVSFITSGTPYRADILVAAYNSTENPTILIGSLNSNARKDSAGTYYRMTNMNPVNNGRPLPVSGGIGKFEAFVTQPGLQHYSGAVLMKGPQGTPEYYPFESEYMVANAVAVVSSDNLNVIYAGVNNPFTVSVPGFSSDKISASISEGSFTALSPGKYIARLSAESAGRTISITVSARMQDGSTRVVAQLPYKVKSIPTPVATINGGHENGGPITVGELLVAGGIGAMLREFYFQGVSFTITSFDYLYIPRKDDIKSDKNNGKIFSPALKEYIRKSKAGDRYIFSNIRALGSDGRYRTLNSIPVVIN